MDPRRRIILWQYEVASATGRQETRVRAGRLWYAPRSERGLPLYVASIPAPHPTILQTQNRLGSPDELLAAQPGEPVVVSVDTDRGARVQKQLREAISGSLSDAGYSVVEAEQTGDDTLHCEVICKGLEKQEIRINMSRSALPDAWDIITRTITPYLSRVAIRRGDTELWSDGWRAEPGHVIWSQRGETIDDALKRLTSPNIEGLVKTRFPSHLAQPGTVTRDGAYGMTKLTSAGIAEDTASD